MTALAKLVVSGLLLSGMALLVDVPAAFGRLSAVAAEPAAIACLLFTLTHMINAGKLLAFLPDRRYRDLLRFTLVAQAYALLLPGQLAGEAVKAYRLGTGIGNDMGQAASAVAFDKLLALVGVLVFTLYGLARDGDGRFPPVLGVAAWSGLALLAVAATALAIPGNDERVRTWMLQRGWRGPLAAAAAAATRFLVTWHRLAGRPHRLAVSLAGGMAAQAVQVLGCTYLGRGLGIDLPFSVWCVVVGGMTAALLAPVAFAGLGVREVSLIGLLGAMEVAPESAIGLSLAILAYQLCAGAVGLLVDAVSAERPAAQ